MKRYSPVIVVLHWLLAIALFVALYMGNDIASLSNDLDLKVDRLAVHMVAGMFIGGAFFARVLLKIFLSSTGNNDELKTLDKTARVFHNLLYITVFGVVLTGVGTAIQIDMQSVLQQGTTLPESLSDLPIRRVHGVLTKVLVVMVAFHILAALYHQFIVKDNLFSKMWFGKAKDQ
ncbi:cytochrome b [Vibrio sp. HN007]|uniref:cytochrome b n=1 Tax=Vibrio iocasae TaxID=3098914 RepID=UPI0035D3E6B2